MKRRRLLAPAVLVVIGVVSALGGVAWSAFSASTSTSASVTAKRIFTGTRTWEARDLRDASSGSEVDSSETMSFSDAKILTTSNWANAFAANRYYDYNYSSNLPAGVPVANMTFALQFASNNGTNSACIYIEVRRYSTDALVETVPSNAPTSNAGCVTAEATVSVALAGVTTSDVANDLRIRVFGRESGARGTKVNRAVVTGTVYGSAFTMYPYYWDDRADTSSALGGWALTVDNDTAVFANATNWPTTFAGTKYLKFTFPSTMVPAGATVTGATFNYSVRGATAGDNICYYFEVYSGASLVTTKGSSGSPICSNAATYTQVNTAIPEINTAALANGAIVKMFVKDTTATRKSNTELASLSVTYSLD